MKTYPIVFQTLQTLLNPGKTTFAKLQGHGVPYTFERWHTDSDGNLCLYYSFPDRRGIERHTKRVPLAELARALKVCMDQGVLTREAFEGNCPIAQSSGPCGFAVTGRCLELLSVARYRGQGAGFKLINRLHAMELINL